MDNAW